MTEVTVIVGLVAVGAWTWIIGDHYDWWGRMSAHLRNRKKT